MSGPLIYIIWVPWSKFSDRESSWSYLQGHGLNLGDRNGILKYQSVWVVWWSVSGTDYVISGNSPQMVVIHKGKHCLIPLWAVDLGPSVSSLQYKKHMVPVLKRSWWDIRHVMLWAHGLTHSEDVSYRAQRPRRPQEWGSKRSWK